MFTFDSIVTTAVSVETNQHIVIVMAAITRKEEEEIPGYPAPFDDDLSFFPGRLDFSATTKTECADGKGSVRNLTIRTAKIIILGESSVGKTSLVNRYFHNSFERHHKATIGVDFMCQQYKILGIPFKMQVWDTAGAERFRSLTYTYFRQARAVLLVYDMSDVSTLAQVNQWHKDAITYCGGTFHTFLIGAKLDLCDKEYNRDLPHKVAKQLDAEYWETSSKSGKNVEEMFTRVAAVIFEDVIQSEIMGQQEQNREVIGKADTLIKVGDGRAAKKKNKKVLSYC